MIEVRVREAYDPNSDKWIGMGNLRSMIWPSDIGAVSEGPDGKDGLEVLITMRNGVVLVIDESYDSFATHLENWISAAQNG